jgi:hypothetical protein
VKRSDASVQLGLSRRSVALPVRLAARTVQQRTRDCYLAAPTRLLNQGSCARRSSPIAAVRRSTNERCHVHQLTRSPRRRFFLTGLIAAAAVAPASGASTTSTTQPLKISAQQSWCAGSQNWQSVRGAIGIPIRVKARIAGVSFASSSSGRPTFIDLGTRYPSRRRVTIVIWGRDRANFPAAPERMFRRGQTVCVQGVASMYRGVPQISAGIWDSTGRLLSA